MNFHEIVNQTVKKKFSLSILSARFTLLLISLAAAAFFGKTRKPGDEREKFARKVW
jgi:hypothetical protein